MERLTVRSTKEAKSNVTIRELLNKLAEYEDLEEQGKLLKMPCKVGYMIYTISRGKIIEMKIEKIEVFLNGKEVTLQLKCSNAFSWGFSHYLTKEIGKTVFLTKSEAEAVLKETENQK